MNRYLYVGLLFTASIAVFVSAAPPPNSAAAKPGASGPAKPAPAKPANGKASAPGQNKAPAPQKAPAQKPAPPQQKAAPQQKGAQKPAPKNSKPKVSCMVCRDYGPDCKSSQTQANCDKCVKITGVPTDTSGVPPLVWQFVEAQSPGAKGAMEKAKGKQVTIRACASQDTIDYITFGESYAPEGCTQYDELFGFKDCNACVCNSDCK